MALGLLLLLAAPGAASAEELSPVLLPVDGDTSIPSLDREIERAFKRQRQKVQRSSLKLEDLMLAVGCKTTSVACLQEIGQSVKASGLILPRARKLREGVEVGLRWFEVKSGGDRGEVVRLLPLDSVAREKILAEAVRALLGEGTSGSREQSGGLAISTSVPHVEILLDGQARGTAPLELRHLSPGSYLVVARRDGYATREERVAVNPDQVTHLQLEMMTAPRPAGGYFESIRPATWLVAGTGLLCVAVGAAFAAHLKAQQDHLDNTQGVTLDEIRQMRDYKETGERDALAANILFGIGGAALVGAVVLSYLDYRRSRRPEPAPSPTPLRGLRLAPGAVSYQVRF